ncbi:MAG: 4Fe-4S dicluster domain-containing protein [Deltaproteobacteria bacterium]|nr:4Fe-4S dicluster domain-containing protein [Deltaproteobacteria bacterium]
MDVTREIYWNIVYGALIYGFMIAALGCLAHGVLRRFKLWQLGGEAARFDRIPERLSGLLGEIFGQRRQLRDPVPGIAHLFIFYGFLSSLIATSLISIQEWTGIHYLKGAFYQWYSLFSDLGGVMGLVGLCIVIWRRGVTRPARLHSAVNDWIALILLTLIFAQGFVVEGLRIAATELTQQPELARWSPGGFLVAQLFSGLSDETLRALHRASWWFHAATAFAFIGYMAYGKFGHILFGIANVFFRNLEPSGKLSYPDIEELADSDPDALDALGVNRIEQFTWKDLLDLDTCVNCGRCEAVCPAYGSGVPLSPRKLIQDMKQQLSDVGPALIAARAANGEGPAEAPSGGPILFGDATEDGMPKIAVLEDEIWGCRTCGACQQECPLFIDHIPKIIDMRRHLVMTESKMSDEAQLFLKNMDDRMHPWVGAAVERDEWYQDLDVKVLGDGHTAEYLFWVGCTGSMQERNIKTTRAMVKILQAADVDFGILGPEEVCTGDPARRAGGELTFQICAKTNIETLANYGVKKIITTCPHCFNTYSNEYPDFGGNYEVVHHTQLIDELLSSGRIKLDKRLDSVTYHDPCYLGRHNGVYDEPRNVLSKLAPGGFTELERNRSKALCCGSGGGYAFMDDDPKQRINHTRLEEVKACGADTAAVSCPFCMQMFEDALNSLDPEKTIRAADIAELVAEALVEPT